MDVICDLLEVHDDFAASLRRVRIAAMDGRLRAARAELDWLAEALNLHIRLEESLLMPWYEGLDVPANQAPAVLIADHRRIQGYFALDLRGDPVVVGDALARFAGALEHHDDREAKGFKPRLDAVLPPEERRKILDVWEAEMQALPPVPCPASETPRPVGPPPEAPLARVRFDLATGRTDPAGLQALQLTAPKARRLREAVAERLAAGDRLGAYDRLRLLHLAEGSVGVRH